jgi:hypothetical protein
MYYHKNTTIPKRAKLQEALARTSDPHTSHDAATSVNTTNQERRVLHALMSGGPMTAEEVARWLASPIPSISPRFRPLFNKNMIKMVEEDDSVVTRPGASGRQRIVWEIELDKNKWRTAKEASPMKPKIASQAAINALIACHSRIDQLERELTELRAEKGRII